MPLPRPEDAGGMKAILDLLADALAERCIVQARAEVAAKLGVAPESLDREVAPFSSPLRHLGLAGLKESA